MNKDDFKGFLQHLRSVHFTMILTAGAILLGISGGGNIYDKALVQLRDVNRLHELLGAQYITDSLVAEIDKPPDPIEEDRSNALDDLLQHSLSEIFEIQIDNMSSNTFKLIYDDTYFEGDDFDSLNWFDHHLAILSDGKSTNMSSLGLTSYGNSLGEKRASLDTVLLNSIVYVNPSFEIAFYTAGSNAQIQEQQETVTLIQGALANAETISFNIEVSSISLADDSSRTKYNEAVAITEEDPIGYEQFDGDFDSFDLRLNISYRNGEVSPVKRLSKKFTLPVMFTKTQVKFLGELIRGVESGDEAYPRYLNGARSTKELFPELHRVTDLLSSADYSELENYLNQQASERNSPINVFGLNIDSKLIGIWGVIVLLFIQIYFCMHYRAFIKQSRPEEDVIFPWIAMYNDSLSKIMFQASLFLPVVVCGFMLYTQGAGSHNNKIAFLIIAFIIFLWSEHIFLKHSMSNKKV